MKPFIYPVTQEHWEKYDALMKAWGAIIRDDEFAGLTREQMREKLRADPHLNNVVAPGDSAKRHVARSSPTLQFWAAQSAHLVGKRVKPGFGASMAEALCAMKHAVVVWCEVEPGFVPWNDPSQVGDYPRLPGWG